MAKRLVKNLEWGARVEVQWEDAFTEGDQEAKNSILCYDLGYFDRSDKLGIKFWREIDEEGNFRWDLSIPWGMIRKVRRLGPCPRGVTRPTAFV